MTLPEFREMLNEQLQLVQLDPERAIAALPKLLDGGQRRTLPRRGRCLANS